MTWWQGALLGFSCGIVSSVTNGYLQARYLRGRLKKHEDAIIRHIREHHQ